MLGKLPTCPSNDSPLLPTIFRGASLGQEGEESEETGEGTEAENGAGVPTDSQSAAGETFGRETEMSSLVLRAGGSSDMIRSTSKESLDRTVSIGAGCSLASKVSV